MVANHVGLIVIDDFYQGTIPLEDKKDAFLKNKIEMEEVDFEWLFGPHLSTRVHNLPDITQLSSSTRQLPRFGKDHNWVKKISSENYLIGQVFL